MAAYLRTDWMDLGVQLCQPVLGMPKGEGKRSPIVIQEFRHLQFYAVCQVKLESRCSLHEDPPRPKQLELRFRGKITAHFSYRPSTT